MNKSKSFVCVWKSVKISKKDNRAFSSIRPTSQLASTKCRFVDWHLSSSHRAPCSEIHFRFVDKKAREGWSRQRQKHQQHFVSFKLSLSISNSFYLYLFLYFDLLSLTLSCCSLSNSVLLMSLYLTLSYFSLQLYLAYLASLSYYILLLSLTLTLSYFSVSLFVLTITLSYCIHLNFSNLSVQHVLFLFLLTLFY